MSLAVRTSLTAALQAAFAGLGLEPPTEVVLERPARREHGDWSTNAALVRAKAAGRRPRELADALAAVLQAAPPAHVTKVEVAGPGFLNFHLADSWLHETVTLVVNDGEAGYARPDIGGGRRVNVEFVSANPTGPLHAGHARWAAYGDALARILAHCGYDVAREFYVNDRGVQVTKYALSLVARKWGMEPPDGFYMGSYVAEWAAEMPAGANPVEWGLEKARRYQEETLARMHVVFDHWSSEKAIAERGDVQSTLDELRAKGHVYEAGDEEKGSATWLRTTDFGDDKDRVLVKSNGDYTYFTPDIAYHRDKFSRAGHLIDILGADHHGYVARMKAAMQCLGHARDDLEIIIGQNVVLLRGGQEVRLSKRTGDIIEMAEIIDEVGPDAAKLTFLLQSIDTRQQFDIDVVKAQSAENPVFYVQYAYARIAGIRREAAERGIERRPLADVDLGRLTQQHELDVARVLADLPDVVRLACVERAPHKITTWVRELASSFHAFYHECPILRDDVDPEVRQARLWLVEAARVGVAIGLGLLGVHAPERM